MAVHTARNEISLVKVWPVSMSTKNHFLELNETLVMTHHEVLEARTGK